MGRHSHRGCILCDPNVFSGKKKGTGCKSDIFFFPKRFHVCIGAHFDLTLCRLAHCGMHRRSLIQSDKAHRRRIALLFPNRLKMNRTVNHILTSFHLFVTFLPLLSLILLSAPSLSLFHRNSFTPSLTHSPVICTPPLCSSGSINHLFSSNSALF